MTSYNSLLHSCIVSNERLHSKRNSLKQNEFPKSTSFINQTFQVYRDYLNKEFNQDYDWSYRNWFFSYFLKDMQQLFKTIYYNQLEKIEENIPFFDWLNGFLSNHLISIPNLNKYYCATK